MDGNWHKYPDEKPVNKGALYLVWEDDWKDYFIAIWTGDGFLFRVNSWGYSDMDCHILGWMIYEPFPEEWRGESSKL